MCSRLRQERKEFRPGQVVLFRPCGSKAPREAVWGVGLPGNTYHTTCARSENLKRAWLNRGWQTGVIRAEFAEGYRRRIWSGIEADLAAVFDGEHCAIVTREATELERSVYGHNRMPVRVVNGRASDAEWLPTKEAERVSA